MADKKSNRQKKKRPKIKEQQEEMHPLAYEVIGLLLIAFSMIAFFEYGIVGRLFHSVAMFLFGNLHFFVPLICIVSAAMLMVRRKGIAFKGRVVYGTLLIGASFTIFSHQLLFENLYASNLLLSDSVLRETWRILISADGIVQRSNTLGGGMIGALLFSALHLLFDATGAKVIAFVLFLCGVLLITGKAFVPTIVEKLPNIKSQIARKKKPATTRPVKKKRAKNSPVESEEAAEDEVIRIVEHEEEPLISKFTDVQQQEKAFEQAQYVEKEMSEPQVEQLIHEELNTAYHLPSISLLTPPANYDQSGEYSVIQANAKKLEQTFASFGVKAKVTQVHLGPAVTKYEVLPDIGVKVSKIVSLQDDLALALAAKDIRIEAPIPGKSAVGIEVPNSEIAVVTLREVLEVKENNAPDEKLLVGLGRDVAGQSILAKLNKMPHLLVAGSTGSGKSVCINGIIISILMRAKPSEVRLMMIDPKMVELSVYNGIPHLLAPVVTDARKAAQALQKVVAEMERRYDLFSYTGTRNIEGYNAQLSEQGDGQKLPYIVVIVDELADLMMVASNEVEEAITRLAQMARAAGIHLILATQRPSVDVITGIIKANIPSRIAFAVSSAVDSRTILDMGGAEKLLGRGDMLYLPAGASKPVRIQGVFVSDNEVECVILNVINQQQAQYEEAMIPSEEVSIEYSEQMDDLYDEAVKIVVSLQTASVSLLQRKLRVGYARAARIIDQLEAHGVVSPPDGSRPRQVLVNKQ